MITSRASAAVLLVLVLHGSARSADPGVISTVVGPRAARAACAVGDGFHYKPFSPTHMVFDPQGRMVIAEFEGHRVVRIESDGSVTHLAGTGQDGTAGDGGPAARAELDTPFYLAFDTQGRLYISDSLIGRVRRVEPDGTIDTVVGGGKTEQEGAPAVSTRIRRVGGIAFDLEGRLNYTDMTAARVRRVDADGTVHTVATGPGDVPAGVAPDLMGAGALAFDAAGNLFVTEYNGGRIREITPDGRAVTVAGTGRTGFGGDGGPALMAMFNNPWGIAARPDGLYVVDATNQRVRRITPDGRVETVAGGGPAGSWGDGGGAAMAGVAAPCCLTFDSQGNLYVNDIRGAIRKVAFGALAPGDMDGDGVVSPADARLLLKFAIGAADPLSAQRTAGDLDSDGRLTVLDVVRLLGRLCGG